MVFVNRVDYRVFAQHWLSTTTINNNFTRYRSTASSMPHTTHWHAEKVTDKKSWSRNPYDAIINRLNTSCSYPCISRPPFWSQEISFSYFWVRIFLKKLIFYFTIFFQVHYDYTKKICPELFSISVFNPWTDF